MFKNLKIIFHLIFLINCSIFYCQNKKPQTFLVDFKVDCKIEETPFFEFQPVFLTGIENNSEGIDYIFYSNGNKYRTNANFLNVKDSITNILKILSITEKDSLISKSKSDSFLIENVDKEIAQLSYEKIKNKPIALSFYSYFDYDNGEIVGKRLYFNLAEKTIKKVVLKANGYDEYGKYLGTKTMIQNQEIKPKNSFKFNPFPWSNPNLFRIEPNEITIEYNDGTKSMIQNKNIPIIKYYYLYLIFGDSVFLSK